MSFIQFESGSAKEKARKDLKDAREELLKNVIAIVKSVFVNLKMSIYVLFTFRLEPNT